MSSLSTPSALERLVWAVDLESLHRRLAAMSPRDHAEASVWYRRNRAKIHRECRWSGSLRQRPDLDPRDPDWLQAFLAATFASPADAADWMPWTRRWAAHGPRRSELVELMKTRGRGWNADFAAAAALQPGCFALVAELIKIYGLPVPFGAPFVEGWMYAFAYDAPADVLADGWQEDPWMPVIHRHFLASGHAGRWTNSAAATVMLIDRGVLDRADVVNQCFEALATAQPPRAERTFANILQSLRLAWSELPGGQRTAVALAEGCHDSVGHLLLPMAFEAATSPAEIRRLINVVAQRKEPRIKRVGLLALRSQQIVDLLGTEQRNELAATLRVTTDDRSIQEQIDRMTGSSREPAPHAAGLWDVPPPQELRATPVRPLPDPDQVDAVLDRGFASVLRNPTPFMHPDAVLRDLLIGELWTDGLLRRAVHDPRSAAGVLRHAGAMPAQRSSQAAVPAALYDIAHSGSPSADYRETLAHIEADARAGRDAWTRKTHPIYLIGQPWLTYLVQVEAAARAGRAPLMLSRPSRDDATIDFDDLVDRLSKTRSAGFGPYDLLQALLRLRIPAPDALAALDGISVPLDASVTIDAHPCRIPDAVAAVRLWVVGGESPSLACRHPNKGLGASG